jgi:hypothetical protein
VAPENGSTAAAAAANQAPHMVADVDGLYVVGEFLGYRERAPREVNGRMLSNVDVGVRIDGGTIETVQFGSLAYATEAVAGAQIGERIAVRVENRHGVKDGRSWQFYTGGRSGSSDAFAGEFRA